jgi:hypothetical protein
MKPSTNGPAPTPWNQLLEAHRDYLSALRSFCAPGVIRVPEIGKGLRTPGEERSIALWVLPYLSMDERTALFPDLLFAARSAHGPVQAVWDALLALPRDWILANIEPEVDAILKSEEEDDYWMFLQFYHQLDFDLMRSLARRAAASANDAIRELGDEYLAKSPFQNEAAIQASMQGAIHDTISDE